MLVKQQSTSEEIEAEDGDDGSGIRVPAGADPRKAIQQLTAKFRRLEPVLQQAEIISARIERRPYSEYLDEIKKTGIGRVEIHGIGLFKHGKLTFHPLNSTALVRERADDFLVGFDEGSEYIPEDLA
jgi:hypothetical protein